MSHDGAGMKFRVHPTITSLEVSTNKTGDAGNVVDIVVHQKRLSSTTTEKGCQRVLG